MDNTNITGTFDSITESDLLELATDDVSEELSNGITNDDLSELGIEVDEGADNVEEMLDGDEEISREEEDESLLEETEEELMEEQDDLIESAAAPEKLIKVFKEDGSEIEIPENGIVKVMVDNVETDVSFEDLKRNYSGKQAWDKRFNELNKEKQEFVNKTQRPIESFVSKFVEASGKSPYAAIAVIAEFAGQDPIEFTNAFKSAARSDALKYLSMDENQRALLDREDELNLKQTQHEMQIRQQKDEAMVQQLQEQIAAQLVELNIDLDEYEANVKSLMEALPPEKHSSINPERVGRWIMLNKRADVVEDALAKINADLLKDERLLTFLVTKSVDDGLDDKTTVEQIQAYYGKPKVPASVKKINSKVSAATKKKPATKQPSASDLNDLDSSEGMTFADLENLFK